MTGGLERITGACVNVHMIYPALVYGFWHVIGTSRIQDLVPAAFPGPDAGPGHHDDHAWRNGEPAAEVRRYHGALARLSERDHIRDDPSRYEACALTLVKHGSGRHEGIPNSDYPPPGSLPDYNRMFERMYAVYDHRFVKSTTALRRTTERRVWHRDSPLLADVTGLGGVPAEMEPSVG